MALTTHLHRLRLRTRALFRGDTLDASLRGELETHIAEQVDEYAAAGMSRDVARAKALRELGPVAVIEEQCRDTRRVAFVQHVWQDLRYGWRSLARQPLLVLAATASIGAAAAANCTIFSLASDLLLAPPSVRAPEQVVRIRMNGNSHVSYRDWQALGGANALADLAGYRIENDVNWRDGQQSVALIPMIVTANFFDALGLPVAMGRGFSADEANVDRQPRLAVVSHRFWERRLQRDPNAVGRTAIFNGRVYTIVGVLPETFRALPGYGVNPEVYLPLSRDLMPDLDKPNDATMELVGRLREGQTIEQARAALAVAGDRMNPGVSRPAGGSRPIVYPVVGLGKIDEVQSAGPFFGVLLAAVGLVLAIACANVAGLLLARSTVRRREIAVRVALGASRARLVQQLMTEGFWLASLGTVAGLALSFVLMGLIGRIELPLPMPIELHAELDLRLAIYALVLLVLTTLFCGLTPALQATKPSLVPALKQDAPREGHRRWTLRGLLVVGQVAVAFVLLLTGLLFVRNLARSAGADTGFDVSRTVVAQIAFVEGRYSPEARLTLLQSAVERLQGLPSIERAAFAHAVPLTIRSGMTTGSELRVAEGGDAFQARYEVNLVGPGYFSAMGIGLARGREFMSTDRSGTPRVAIVNEEFARRHLQGIDPIGRHLVLPGLGRETYPVEIVGVVRNSRHRSIGEAQQAAIYESYLQRGSRGRIVHVLLRARGDSDGAARPSTGSGRTESDAVRDAAQVLAEIDPTAAVEVQPMRSALGFAFLPSRIGAALLGVLGVLGLVLAMAGLYAVVSYGVSRRTAEIGIRLALGATRAAVLRLVLTDALVLVLLGLSIGTAVAALVTRPLAMFLVTGLSASDPGTFAATGAALTLVSLVAAWVPARRALAIDPTTALRAE